MTLVQNQDGQIDDFVLLTNAVRVHFDKIQNKKTLFVVDVGNIYQAYLENLAPEVIKEHSCHCCRRFMEQYGALVTIDDNGVQTSAIWDVESAPEMYKASVKAMADLVAGSKVLSTFHTAEKTWGTPRTGTWTHFSVLPKKAIVHSSGAKSAFEIMALSKENHRTLSHGLSEFDADVVAQALNLIQAESLYRSEKVQGPAMFLFDLHNNLKGKKGARAKNIVWKAVASAPVVFCTPRSSMIGTLLEDIKKGFSAESVKSRFSQKMNPLQYQRPQAAPSEGNIKAAEKLVEKLGIHKSLERRFAVLEEIPTIWKPEPVKEDLSKKGGVFGHLKAKNTNTVSTAIVAPLKEITFEKFRRTVMPNAQKIEVYTGRQIQLRVIVTATHADAPPIIQWDNEVKRNPFTSYIYPSMGSNHPSDWNLNNNTYVEVTGIALNPAHWHDEESFSHHAKSAIFLLDGAIDKHPNGGLGIFPENLKSDLHEVSATIEAYSRKGELSGRVEASAIGLNIQGSSPTENLIRVTTSLGIAEYKIDRWD